MQPLFPKEQPGAQYSGRDDYPQKMDDLPIAMNEMFHQTSLQYATEEANTIEPFLQVMGLVAAEGIKQTDGVLQNPLSRQIIDFTSHGMSYPLDPANSCLPTEDWETKLLTGKAP